MNKILLPMLALVFVFGTAQSQPGGGRMRMGPERLEKYKKMRMIEVLNLNEDEAARFTAKYSTHESTVRDLMKQRMDIIDRLEGTIQKTDSDKNFDKLFSELEENDQKMFNERKRFQDDLKNMLTTEQMARYFVFDRNFNRELREAMEEMRGGHRRP